METSAAEMRMLSDRFYGNKIFFATHYDSLKDHYNDENKVKQVIQEIYSKYIEQLILIVQILIYVKFSINIWLIKFNLLLNPNSDFRGALVLSKYLDLFFKKHGKKDGIKIKHLMNQDKYQLDIRSLGLANHFIIIRPPHSVFIFSLEDIKNITLHFLNTFFRYYNAYFFAFTPLVYLEVRTSEVKVQRDQRDENIEALRQEAEQYNEVPDEELLEQLMKGNSIHQIPQKKREELMRLKQEKERQERIDRILKKKLTELEKEFELKAQEQDEEFMKKVEDLKHPKKK